VGIGGIPHDERRAGVFIAGACAVQIGTTNYFDPISSPLPRGIGGVAGAGEAVVK